MKRINQEKRKKNNKTEFYTEGHCNLLIIGKKK